MKAGSTSINAIALVLALLGAGCDRPATPVPAPAPAPDPAPLATPVATPAPEPVVEPGVSPGTTLPILRAVRIGKHPDRDRLVFEFDSAAVPEWQLEYVDRPVRDCGSGDPVPVAGDAWLQIRFSAAQAHTDEGEATSGPRRRHVGQSVLLELVRTCDFEGEVTWVAGVATPNAYATQVLSDPARLVVDIAH